MIGPNRRIAAGSRQAPRFAGLLAVALALGVLAAPLRAQGLFDADPIYDYARNRDVGAVDYLVKKGAKIDEANPAGETVLLIAAGNGDLAMVELALRYGARVDREDKFGKTALAWAVDRGHVPVVEKLLAAGADINHQSQDGLTPVMLAARSNHLAVLQVLLKHKPDLSVLDYTGRGALGWARASRDPRGEAMLQRAGARD